MAEFKLTISNKDGKTTQKEVKDAHAAPLIGKKIGDKLDGGPLGFAGYEFELTGGSDYAGVPMRKDVQGTARKRILAISGVGMKKKNRRGQLQRKMVAGNTVHDRIAQINVKILKAGKDDLFSGAEAPQEEKKEAAPKEEKKPEKEEKPAEKPKEEKKETPNEEKKAEPKKEEKPKDDKKEEKPKKEDDKKKKHKETKEEKPKEEKKEKAADK